MKELLARRPILIALAGPNGAGKSTFYKNFIEDVNLPFVNADVLSAQLQIDPYSAASLADKIRRELLSRSQSFVFETVFSDPVGDKIEFIKHAESAGYTLCCFSSEFQGLPLPKSALPFGSPKADTMFQAKSWLSAIREYSKISSAP